MDLSIRTRSVELTEQLRKLVAKRIHLAFDAFGDRVGHTSVYLMDLNGPRGGVDKLCQVSAQVQGIGDVVVRETGPTVPAAVNRAVRRLKYRISETLRQAGKPPADSIRTAPAPV